MAQNTVTISFSGTTISVDKNKVDAKQGVDTVQWTGSVQFEIKKLPGGTVTSSLQNNKWVATAGPWNSQGKLKYDVTASGYTDLDPEIDVIP